MLTTNLKDMFEVCISDMHITVEQGIGITNRLNGLPDNYHQVYLQLSLNPSDTWQPCFFIIKFIQFAGGFSMFNLQFPPPDFGIVASAVEVLIIVK